ncbi:MAG: hypothetical protein A2Y20_00630 [Firmicutes bacterium GWF2_51_9]|jgi:hypothetical protein|nr:hypothetical protein [Erysipelotrichaceae bacterium]OGS52959.1 MAG: hypothetical protein A2Y20_00630 [Firmicutes bacterium GWF2_51_9]OGS57754.1 MAG: hypothetical protein A2Y19_00370 [Firmicutes bacterium GWE2_51_13]HAM62997.1 hypothetical protein [Erysipelotrichaceae bacterium]HBZ40598.1 hypothetical protein [Erysipelotrichaceae bacterium]
MKSTIHACPNCHAAWSGDPLGTARCPECDAVLVPLHLDKEAWDRLSVEEKESKKNETFNQVANRPHEVHLMSQEFYLRAISEDIHTIKILLICVVLVLPFLIFLGIIS